MLLNATETILVGEAQPLSQSIPIRWENSVSRPVVVQIVDDDVAIAMCGFWRRLWYAGKNPKESNLEVL